MTAALHADVRGLRGLLVLRDTVLVAVGVTAFSSTIKVLT
jgi:uncharacterized membrane protein YkgB